MCMGVLYAYVCAQVCAWYLQRQEQGLGSTGTGLKDAYKPPYGCWESNSGPLKEQPELLTTASVKYRLDDHSNYL